MRVSSDGGDSVSGELTDGAVAINPAKLNFRPLPINEQIRLPFDCEDDDLNEFILTSQASDYQKELVGHTTLVFFEEELVAYFTVSAGHQKTEYAPGRSLFNARSAQVRNTPAILIGRIAVDRKWKNRGVGTIIFKRILSMAIGVNNRLAVRILAVHSLEGSVGFYEKIGFKELPRMNSYLKLMFFDILRAKEIRDFQSKIAFNDAGIKASG